MNVYYDEARRHIAAHAEGGEWEGRDIFLYLAMQSVRWPMQAAAWALREVDAALRDPWWQYYGDDSSRGEDHRPGRRATAREGDVGRHNARAVVRQRGISGGYNGPNSTCGGLNYPYRGWKDSNWEGVLCERRGEGGEGEHGGEGGGLERRRRADALQHLRRPSRDGRPAGDPEYEQQLLAILERLAWHNFTAVPCRYPPRDPRFDLLATGVIGPFQPDAQSGERVEIMRDVQGSIGRGVDYGIGGGIIASAADRSTRRHVGSGVSVL